MNCIEIKNVTKRYGKFCALDDISLSVEPNKIYGLLGRNGAGKTTLLNMIANRIFPTSGEIIIEGSDISSNDSAVGKIYYMVEKNLYPHNMKVKDIFKWTKEFYPDFDMEYAFILCQKFALDPNKKIKSLSTGYNSISKLITTLASNAEILFFDEPILGLDAHHRDLFYKELLASYIEKPKTIVLSTHIIEEISDLLERVIIIKDKKVLLNEDVETLLKRAYCVSGTDEAIDKFITGKSCINIDTMASFKSATIMGDVKETDKEETKNLGLEFSKVELQKLFIYLTSEGGVKS